MTKRKGELRSNNLFLSEQLIQLKTSKRKQVSSDVHKPFQQQKKEVQFKVTQILHHLIWKKRQMIAALC